MHKLLFHSIGSGIERGEMPGTLLERDARNDVERVSGDPVKEDIKRVTFGVCLKGHTPPASYHDRMIMSRYLGERETMDFYEKKSPRYVFNFSSCGEIFVPYAREQLGTFALDTNSDYLFMVDDDMMAPPELFFDLVKHDVDIVAPLAFTRNPPHKPVAFQAVEGWDPATQSDYYLTTNVMNYPRNSLFECDAVGFGAVLIKTEVLKKMAKPWFMGSHGTGEDLHFCIAARKLGFHVFMDSATKLGHLSSPLIVTEEYADSYGKLSSEERERVYGNYQKYPSLERSR